MGVEPALIEEIVQRVLSVSQPERIILYGSAATGSMNRDSDIDLLVIEPSPADARQRSVRIRRALRGLGYPFDIVVIATQWFEETKNVVGGLAYPANKYGRVIYERG
jgi:predicted nucleotidyltransferase